MKRLTRILLSLGAGLTALAAIAMMGVYGVSQWHLSRSYSEVPPGDFQAPAREPALVAEGERLARIHGCFGCHGQALEGRVFMDEPWLARIVAPNLTHVVTEYSDAELERVIRRGVRRDGRGVWVMPSDMYYHLSDDDLGAILAYLRSLPLRDGLEGEMTARLLGRVGIATGVYSSLTADFDWNAARVAHDRADPVALGRYLAATSCTECHGADLGGADDTPDLRLVAAYDTTAFTRFLRTGVALGDRETPFMSRVARDRFSHLKDEEITALHVYLRQRAEGSVLRESAVSP